MKQRLILIMATILLALSVIAYASGAQVKVLAAEQRIHSPNSQDFGFELPQVTKGEQVRLALDARVDWPTLDGFSPFLKVSVNGTNLDGPELMNKLLEFATRNEMDATWNSFGAWMVVYSPDFSDAIKTQPIPYGFPDVDPYHFVWDITPYVKSGSNKIVLTHPQILSDGTVLVLRNVEIETGAPIESKNTTAKGPSPAPTGHLQTYVPRGPQHVRMNVQIGSGGTIRLRAGGRSFEVATRTSEPEGRWLSATSGTWKTIERNKSDEAKWSGIGYEIVRRVTVSDDHISVADTIKNTTDSLIGVIYENRLGFKDQPVKVLLAGHPACGPSDDPGHPTAVATWKDMAVGIAAEDDIFRVHSRAFNDPDAIGLADPQLGITPGGSQTLEWSIYPVPKGDYWDFINAVRRNWGSNYTIPGATAFDNIPPDRGEWSDTKKYQDLLRKRGTTLILDGQPEFLGDEVDRYGGKYNNREADGTATLLAKRWAVESRAMSKQVHEADPNLKLMVYLNSQICTEPGAEELYADSRLLDANGKPVTSPYSYPLYVYLTTLQSSYGKSLFAALPYFVDETGADGIFWDEFAFSTSPWAYNTAWDGCTVIIDPKTHAVTGRRSSSILLQQPWKVKAVDYIRGRGKLLTTNFAIHTRTMLRKKILSLVEICSYAQAIWGNLGTPWCMGEMTPTDLAGQARMTRRILKFGGLHTPYGWYNEPKSESFFKWMYPFTPVELHEDMVFGEERIVTNRSGIYGWPDGKPAVVHVIDGEGRPVAKPDVKEFRKNGKWLAEIRMPSDNFAILVKQ